MRQKILWLIFPGFSKRLRQCGSEVANTPILAPLSSIACPLLVIRGDEDFLVSRRQAFEMAEQVEGARLLNLPFASDTVLEDLPEQVLPAYVEPQVKPNGVSNDLRCKTVALEIDN